MAVTVRIPTPLRPMAGGKPEVTMGGKTVAEVIAGLAKEHPELVARITDPGGKLSRYVNFFVND